VWVHSYTLGVASARAIERMMSHEPGLRWLAASETINHHTLADFRVGHREALEGLFVQFLALLDEAGVVDLRTLVHDGTKVKAVAQEILASTQDTGEATAAGTQAVRALDQQAAEEEAMNERRRAAQARAAKEALARAQAALKKLQELEAAKAPSQRPELRVSESEPEARNMKQPDGGWAPSYNVQISTETQSRIIVGVRVTTAANDTQELLPALETVKENCGELPATIMADTPRAAMSSKPASRRLNSSRPGKKITREKPGLALATASQRSLRPRHFVCSLALITCSVRQARGWWSFSKRFTMVC
jgi:hypothetical protein